MATTVSAYALVSNGTELVIKRTGEQVLTGARVADKVGFNLLPVQTGSATPHDINDVLKRNERLSFLGVNNAASTAYFAAKADMVEFLANGDAASRTRLLQVLKSTTHDLTFRGAVVRFKVVDSVSDGVVGMMNNPELLAKVNSNTDTELAAQVRILKRMGSGTTLGAKGLMLMGDLCKENRAQAVASSVEIPEGYDGVLFADELKVLGKGAELPTEIELEIDRELLLHADKPVTRQGRGITPAVAMLLPEQSRNLVQSKVIEALEELDFSCVTIAKLEELTKAIGGLERYEAKLELIRSTHGNIVPESEHEWVRRLLRVVTLKTFGQGGKFKAGTAYSVIAAEGAIPEECVIVPRRFGVRVGDTISVGRHPMTFGVDGNAVNGFQKKTVVGYTAGNVILIGQESLSRMDGDEDGDVLVCDLGEEFMFSAQAPVLAGPGEATKLKKPLLQLDCTRRGDVELLHLMGSFASAVGLVHNSGTSLIDIARNKGIEEKFWSKFGNVLTAFLTAAVYVQKHDAEVTVGDTVLSSKVKVAEGNQLPLNAENALKVIGKLAESVGISNKDVPSSSYFITKKAEKASLSVWDVDGIVQEIRAIAERGVNGEYSRMVVALLDTLKRIDEVSFEEAEVPMTPVVAELANRCVHRLDELYMAHVQTLAPRKDGKVVLKHFHETKDMFKRVVDNVVSEARRREESPCWAAIELNLVAGYEELVATIGDKFSTRFMVTRALLHYVSNRRSAIGHAVRILNCDEYVKAALLQSDTALMDVVVPEATSEEESIVD